MVKQPSRFEKEVLERILILNRQEVTGRREIRPNEVLHNFSPARLEECRIFIGI